MVIEKYPVMYSHRVLIIFAMMVIYWLDVHCVIVNRMDIGAENYLYVNVSICLNKCFYVVQTIPENEIHFPEV